MTIQNLQTPSSQLWSDSLYNYATRGKGMDTVARIESFGTSVEKHSNNIDLRLHEGTTFIVSGTIAISGTVAVNATIFTLPVTLHNDCQFTAAIVNESEVPQGETAHIMVKKDGVAITNTGLTTGQYIKLDGMMLKPNMKPGA